MTNKVVVYLYYFTFDRPTHRSTTNNGRSETSPVQLSKQNKSCYSSWCRFASGFLNFHPAAKQNQQPTPREQKFPYFAHCCWFGANGWLLAGYSTWPQEEGEKRNCICICMVPRSKHFLDVSNVQILEPERPLYVTAPS